MREIILAAAGANQLRAGLTVAEKQHFVVFGTLDGEILASLKKSTGIPVYLFETG